MCWVLKNYGLRESEKCAQKFPEPSGRFFTWLTVLIIPLLNLKLLLRLNGNRGQLKCVLLGRGISMVLVWMFHPMHVLLSSCNIFSGIGQSLISCDHWFILQNISFDKCRITSRVSVLNCLYFHSSCLHWPIIVATNGMVALNSSAWLKLHLSSPRYFVWQHNVLSIRISQPFLLVLQFCFDSASLHNSNVSGGLFFR